MRSFSILLVALVVTVGLCKGAAIEKGNKLAAEEEEGTACKGPASLCGRKKREVDVQESPVEAPVDPGRKKREVEQLSPEVSPSVGDCKDFSSLCGRKKREVEQESPVEAPVDPGRKKRDVEQLSPPPNCPVAAICGRKKREVDVQESPVREDK